jgi:hypothetical protein
VVNVVVNAMGNAMVNAMGNAKGNAEVNAEVNVVAAGGNLPASGRGGTRPGSSRGADRGSRNERLVESQASKQAREAAGLCVAHWQYGQQAYACKSPATCTWQGNGQAGAN